MPVHMGLVSARDGGVFGGNVYADTTRMPTRKRQRTLVSCTECHRRKQKCDRQWPCGNCTSRSASHLCQYERRANKEDLSRRKNLDSNTQTEDSGNDQCDDSDDLDSIILTTGKDAKEFGYSAGMFNTSLNVLEKLDIGGDNQSFSSDRAIRFANPNDLQTYNNFIRLLPARPYTNLLVQVFFTEANFLYGTLHQQTFNKILDEWWAIATNSNRSAFSAATGVSTSGIPSTKPPTSSNDPYILKDIHFFPALLLQVLATAVQLLPREHYDFMNQMKLGMCESFQDLSTQFSNASCELSLLLGGTCTSSLARVQQPFLRAAWLKNEGRIHEAWHSLGTAIRSAQEQGLHLGGRQRTGERNLGLGSSVLEEVRKLWYREMEKRVWINLYSWDRFMSMLLGRPMMINDRHCTVTPPIDCEIPSDLAAHPPRPRGVMDPPTPFTQRILEFKLTHLINELDDFDSSNRTASGSDSTSGPGGQPDLVRLDALHARIMAFSETFPPEFSIVDRGNKRESKFDAIRPYIPIQAALLKCTFYSIVVALHRPCLFIREKSRLELVKACLIMLESQDTIVKLLKEHHHRIYTLCFFTFDPAVLIAAAVMTKIESLDGEIVEECVVALRAGFKRLRLLGMNVKLAEKGAVIIRVLLKKVESVVQTWRWRASQEMEGPVSGGKRGGDGSNGSGSSSTTSNGNEGRGDSRASGGRPSPNSYIRRNNSPRSSPGNERKRAGDSGMNRNTHKTPISCAHSPQLVLNAGPIDIDFTSGSLHTTSSGPSSYQGSPERIPPSQHLHPHHHPQMAFTSPLLSHPTHTHSHSSPQSFLEALSCTVPTPNTSITTTSTTAITYGLPSLTATAIMPQEWDSTGLNSFHFASGVLPPPGSNHGYPAYGDNCFEKFPGEDGGPGMTVDGQQHRTEMGANVQSGSGVPHDWTTMQIPPTGDGLWQSLLGMFDGAQ